MLVKPGIFDGQNGIDHDFWDVGNRCHVTTLLAKLANQDSFS
ncbi:hypothetical protein GALL_440780 [mine drainage metagenome]|uniref:Uncharacterized protein n=1 Tax=mine drainage metagenome TaxID=410659 RepID=A0A1J5Q318_9ZZZZ